MILRELRVVMGVWGDERYIVLFSEENKGEACRTLGRWASDPELSFHWNSAAVMARKIRESRFGELNG